jgi:hypothetical protein
LETTRIEVQRKREKREQLERESRSFPSGATAKGKSHSKQVIAFLVTATVLTVGGLYLATRPHQSPPPERVPASVNPSQAAATPVLPFNNPANEVLILDMIKGMPSGGYYSDSSESVQKLETAIKKEGDHLIVDADVAKPSFGSSATYLVFGSALEELNRRMQIEFKPELRIHPNKSSPRSLRSDLDYWPASCNPSLRTLSMICPFSVSRS